MLQRVKQITIERLSRVTLRNFHLENEKRENMRVPVVQARI